MDKKEKSSKCIVLLSGGQDSATCLSWAINRYEEVHSVSFDYGQRHKVELECSFKLSELAGVSSHTVIPVSSLPYIKGSSLVDKDSDISLNHPKSEKLPASFVPGRNYIFLGLAAALAFKKDINTLVTGVCETDYSGYPDCREETIQSISISLSKAMDYSFKIVTPLMHISKSETVIMMRNLGTLDWYKYTHTCYEGFQPPCGKCPACLLRIKGFEEAGISDPLMEI